MIICCNLIDREFHHVVHWPLLKLMKVTTGLTLLSVVDVLLQQLGRLLWTTHAHTCAHARTHTTVLWPSWILSGTTRMSQRQKGKPISIYWSKR